MRSLVLEDTRRLAWHDIPDPERRHEREAIVRPIAVATCDLDPPEQPAVDVLVVGGGG